MGLFDKIKSMANAVTGKSAKVSLEANNAVLNAPFEVTVRAQSQGSEVKYEKVYLKIEGIEKIEVPDTEVVYQDENTENRKLETVNATTTLLTLELSISGSGVIRENATEEWKATVELPKNSMPEYKGKHAEHFYRILAGLDCVGNDPDTGWVRLTVR